VSRFTQELLALPAQPFAAEQVLRIAGNPSARSFDVARVVETDPAVTARVLRLANSRYYGAPRRVANTTQAIATIGVDAVRGLAISAARDLLEGHVAPGPVGFWNHAITTATAASVIARKVGVSREDAFSLGLLHDIGGMLLHRRDEEAFADAIRQPSVSEQVAAELAAFGITHADAGAAALDAWGFPTYFVEAVASHQHGVKEPQHVLARILQVADAVARERAPMSRVVVELDMSRMLTAIRLRVEDLDEIHREFDTQLDLLADFLGSEP
jgi:putative nucleotidyltransferase with HDIG domain